MNREPVQSSHLSSVGFDTDSQTLEVEFRDGNVYQYFDVPEAVHLELMGSSSVGQYFSSNVRNSFRYARV